VGASADAEKGTGRAAAVEELRDLEILLVLSITQHKNRSGMRFEADSTSCKEPFSPFQFSLDQKQKPHPSQGRMPVHAFP
jgi:hypothetical protein